MSGAKVSIPSPSDLRNRLDREDANRVEGLLAQCAEEIGKATRFPVTVLLPNDAESDVIEAVCRRLFAAGWEPSWSKRSDCISLEMTGKCGGCGGFYESCECEAEAWEGGVEP
jgi:hypothetical protein